MLQRTPTGATACEAFVPPPSSAAPPSAVASPSVCVGRQGRCPPVSWPGPPAVPPPASHPGTPTPGAGDIGLIPAPAPHCRRRHHRRRSRLPRLPREPQTPAVGPPG